MTKYTYTTSFGARWLDAGGAPPVSPPPPMRPRLYIDGTRIMLPGSSMGVAATEFVPRGTVNGHGEIYRNGDAAFVRAKGANCMRTGRRWWGTYGQGFQVDSELDPDPGYTNEDYQQNIIDRVINECYAAGLRTNLFNDSNCGQGIDTGEVCQLDTGVAQDFFTPAGATKRQQFIDGAVHSVRRNLGKIDFMEPLVEPAGTATQSTLWAFQQEFMDAVLAVDPKMLFIVGACPNYQANLIDKAFNPEWKRSNNRFHGKIILTSNLLSGLASNPTLRVQRTQMAADARTHWQCPVYINQMGTTVADDPTNAHLDAMMSLLRDVAGGPMGWTFWEQFSIFPNSYGPWSLQNPNDPNSTRVSNDARWDVLQSHLSNG